jgi:ribonuclease HII
MMLRDEVAGSSVAAIRERVKALPEDAMPAWIEALNADNRKGVRAIAGQLQKKQKRREAAAAKIREHQAIERTARTQGYTLISGIDEVGRGPLAGPVVAAAVILPERSAIAGIDDSKKLSAKRRETLNAAIRDEAVAIGIGVVDPETIDAMNILEATKLAMTDAVAQLAPQPDLLLIDALKLPSQIPVQAVVHGDARCYCIGAASIVAKVYRDRLMQGYARIYPEYDFEHNMGYGTAAHIEALRACGPTPIHRRSFIAHFVQE